MQIPFYAFKPFWFDAGLSLYDKIVLALMAARSGRGKVCFSKSSSEVAGILDVSEKTVKSSWLALEKAEYLRRVYIKGLRRRKAFELEPGSLTGDPVPLYADDTWWHDQALCLRSKVYLARLIAFSRGENRITVKPDQWCAELQTSRRRMSDLNAELERNGYVLSVGIAGREKVLSVTPKAAVISKDGKDLRKAEPLPAFSQMQKTNRKGTRAPDGSPVAAGYGRAFNPIAQTRQISGYAGFSLERPQSAKGQMPQ